MEQNSQFLTAQDILDPYGSNWREAARMYAELRWRGKTVRSVIDCCIAQMAIERNLDLLHNDRDFETIATIRPLRQQRIDLTKGTP